MTVERNNATEISCSDCGHIFEYEGLTPQHICPSCEDKREVEMDAERYKKAREDKLWANPHKHRTYNPERSRSLDLYGHVFEKNGHVRIVYLDEDDNWVIVVG